MIGEIRSLLPNNTNPMALTANIKTCNVILESLEMSLMRYCHIVAKTPNKLNIHYAILPKPASDIIEVFHPVINDIIHDGTVADKYLCFCRTYMYIDIMIQINL